MKPTGLLAVGIAVGSIVVACDDDTDRLTKDEFIEEADAICGDTNELVAPIFEAVWDDVEDNEVVSEDEAPLVFVRFDRAVGEAMPHFERQLAWLRELEPPADDEDLIDALLDDHETALAEGAELVKAAAGGDEAAMAALDSDDPLADVDRRARDYGMTVCGGNG